VTIAVAVFWETNICCARAFGRPQRTRARAFVARIARTHARVPRDAGDMAIAVAPSPSAPPRSTRDSGFPALPPRREFSSAGDDHLAAVVEHLERELSRREASERRLARELEAARADIAERDAHIEDVCSQWERSVTQMQAARDEDVARLTERLESAEQVEIPSLRRRIEELETDCLRARASAESKDAKLLEAERQMARVVADCERTVAVNYAELHTVSRRRETLLNDCERRRDDERAALERKMASLLAEKERAFELEREATRINVERVVAGAVAAERIGARAARLDPAATSDRTRDLDVAGMGRSHRGGDRGGDRDGDRDDDRGGASRGDDCGEDATATRISEDGSEAGAAARGAADRFPDEPRAVNASASTERTGRSIGDGDVLGVPGSVSGGVEREGCVDSFRGDFANDSEVLRAAKDSGVSGGTETTEASLRPFRDFRTPNVVSSSNPSPKPRGVPPPLPASARRSRAIPDTYRGPTYVKSALVPPPPPR